LLGGGSLQDLLLTLEQSGPHADHEVQVDHLPSTAAYNGAKLKISIKLRLSDLRDGKRMNTSVSRISIETHICARFKRLVHVNTGFVFVLSYILLQFATHYYNLLYVTSDA